MEYKTLTFKMNKEIKENLYKYCDKNGLKIGRFLERAIANEIERELLKEKLLKESEEK